MCRASINFYQAQTSGKVNKTVLLGIHISSSRVRASIKERNKSNKNIIKSRFRNKQNTLTSSSFSYFNYFERNKRENSYLKKSIINKKFSLLFFALYILHTDSCLCMCCRKTSGKLPNSPLCQCICADCWVIYESFRNFLPKAFRSFRCVRVDVMKLIHLASVRTEILPVGENERGKTAAHEKMCVNDVEKSWKCKSTKEWNQCK